MKCDTWLKNPVVESELFIDIDIPFISFIYSFHYTVMKMKVKKLLDVFGDIDVYIRESSSGNVHIKLKFNAVELFEGFTFFDSLIIRGFMDDDPKRIRADMQRYFEGQTTDETNRIFDVKIKGNEVFNAGQWLYLNPIWDGRSPNTPYDYKGFWEVSK